MAKQQHHADDHRAKQPQGHGAAADGGAHDADVAAGHARKAAIEAAEEARGERGRGRPRVARGRLEQQRAQRRRERQGDECGQQRRYRDRDRKLPVERAGNAAHEGHRHEHCRKHQRRGDHRSGHLLHGPQGRGMRIQTRLDMLFDRLHDHDGVVHDDPDREHHAKQRERVQCEAEHDEYRQRSHQGHGHGQQGNQRGAPTLQEYENDERHEHHRLGQRLDDFVEGGRHEERLVDDHIVGEIRRKGGFQHIELRAHRFGHGHRAGLGREVDPEGRRGPAVVPGLSGIVLGAELDTGDVAQVHERSVALRLDDDAAELLLGDQTPPNLDAVLKCLVRRRGVLADRPCGGLHVLFADRRGHIGGGDPELGHAIRLEPDAHAEVAAEHLDAAHTGHPLDRFDDVDVEIVAQEEAVVASLRRIEGDEHQRVGRALGGGHTGGDDFRGQRRTRLRDSILYLHGRRVGVAVEPERDIQRIGAGARGGRLHVHHSFDAVHLLLNRLGNRLFHRLSARTRIERGDDDGRQGYLRVLGNRQLQARDHADEHEQQRRHDGKDRTGDEEASHRLGCGRVGAAVRGCRGTIQLRFGDDGG